MHIVTFYLLKSSKNSQNVSQFGFLKHNITDKLTNVSLYPVYVIAGIKAIHFLLQVNTAVLLSMFTQKS